MAVISSTKDFWMHQNGLTFSINYFGNPQLIQTSLLAGAVILAYRKDVIGYNAAHNFREWKLQAFPTQLSDTCTYYVHVELSRTGNTAMVIYSPVIRDMQGRTLLSGNRVSGTYDDNVSADSWFIYIGTLSASVDSDGNTVERTWTDGVYTGTLATDQYRMEEASGDWVNMFSLNSVTGLIDVLKTISKATINALTVAKEFIFGGKTLTGVAGASDTLDQSKVNDATLPTTGYTKKYVGDEIAALDDHFLIKDDPDTEQSVAGPVTFEKDVTVQGDHAVGKSQTIGGNQTIGGTQEVKGVQTLHQGFKTPSFFQQGDIIQGAQVDADGNAAFTSITAPVMQIYELQYNRKTAVQEEFIFSDGDAIETVTYIQADGTEIDSTVYNGEEYSYIRLGVRKQYEGYMTTFKDEDILYANINIIGESGQPATTGKCWMRVLALDNDLGVEPISSDGLFINALLYSTSQCPAGVNMAPTPHMIISRHGNAGIDEDGKAKYPERQSVFIISTASENMVMLRGISAPIIPQTDAYAIVSGKLPKSLFDKVHSYASYISKDDPVSYARYGIFENMIQLDHEGSPIKTERYRGVWSEDIAKGDEDNRYRSKYATDITYYDTVSHEGSKWACEDDKTTEAPSDSSTKWTKIVSKGDDGTSIKVSGSYETIEAFHAEWMKDGAWVAPPDESQCYVVAGDLYVWVQNDAKWDNVGRFKGDKGDKGDSVTGSTIQYAVNQSMTTKPNEDEFIDDYPTVINEGDVLWTRTRVNFDNATIKTEWAYSASRQGKNGLDNSSVTFELQPNVTTIYIHDEDNLSTESINLTVRKATSKGVEIIDNNADLEADGFKLQYTYDGILEDRKDIVLNPETILLEDGSEMLLEDDSAAELEFTVEDILNVKNYIEFYLVNVDTNEIWATCTVAVVHDGESLTSLIVTPKTIFANVVAGGNKIIDPTKEHTIVFQIKKGDKPQLLSNYTIEVSAGGLVLANIKDEDSYTKSFVITCRNGSSIPPTHTITATKGSLTITEEVTIHPVQQGLVGSSGKLYYSMGYWDETTAAEKYYVNDDKRICYIYHVDSFYERTDNPLKTYKDENGKTRYYPPNEEVANFGSSGGWAVMPKYSAIIADFIMANFARFGSPNGGVFYSNLLFSAMGLDKAGNQVPYDTYSDSMFVGDDENGYRLSGDITPNLFLDFLTGAIKGNKFNEPFVKIPSMNEKESAGYLMDANVGHNVSIGRRANNIGYNPVALFLPPSEASFDVDGANCSIIVQAKANTSDRSDYDAWDEEDVLKGIGNKIVMLCSDGMIAKTGEQSNTTFMVNGVQTKFLFLEHGGFVKLKSCEVDEGVIWIVENQTDFEPIKVKVSIKNEAVVIDGNNPEYEFDCTAIDTFYTMSMGIAYGSKYIRGIMDKNDSESKLLYNVIISKNEDDVNYVHSCIFSGTE